MTRHGHSLFAHELSSDPTGVGFAYGGVEPGRLHAKGQLIESHRVHYSIARCGKYWLHVALRHDGTEIPGSPFLLRVTAGPAKALATSLPAACMPLHGIVGLGHSGLGLSGCLVLLQSSDRAGNACTSGGDKVATACDKECVQCKSTDNGDGTYALEWRSVTAGTFEVQCTTLALPPSSRARALFHRSIRSPPASPPLRR